MNTKYTKYTKYTKILLIMGLLGLLGLFLWKGKGNIIEGFGQGAQAQISSNQGDNTLYGGGGGSPMAANEYGSGSMYSSRSQGLEPTTAQQYKTMTGIGYGSSGVPNYAGHRPARPIHQPEFTPEIQNQFLRYERALAAERRKNAMLQGGQWRGGGIIGQLLGFVEQLFRFVLGVLNILIGWLF